MRLGRAASSKDSSTSTCCRLPRAAPKGEKALPSNLVVLSHREPYAEVQTQEGPRLQRKTNGVFSTLDTVMQQQRGTWIAWREHASDSTFDERIKVPDEAHPQAYDV